MAEYPGDNSFSESSTTSSGSDDGVPVAAVEEMQYDPERNQRIQQMMIASSMDTLRHDDGVTDFLIHMQKKNAKMMQEAQQIQQQQQEQQPVSMQRPSGHSSEEEDDDDFSWGHPTDELEASFQGTNKRKTLRENSPDEYPPGEAYAGDEIGTEEEIPSYDPKEEDLLPYGRLCCIALCLVFLMITTSILILMFVVVVDGEERERNHDNGIVIPTAPKNLKHFCDPSALTNQDAKAQCKDACRKAACCWETGERGDEKPACWTDNPLECAPYEVCVNLISNNNDGQAPHPSSTIPPAPAGVTSCDPNSIDSVDEVLLCEDACSYAPCCWKDSVESCKTDLACEGYQPCDILNTGGSSSESSSGGTPPKETIEPIPDAPDNLADLCNPPADEMDVIESCVAYCDMARCCWKSETTTVTQADGSTLTESVTGKCASQPGCEAYAPCRTLDANPSTPAPAAPNNGGTTTTSSTKDNNFPSPPASLETDCAPENTSGLATCYAACSKATCCWRTETVTTTMADGTQMTESIGGTCADKPACQAYLPCFALETSNGITGGSDSTTTTSGAPDSIPQAPSDLESQCYYQGSECRASCAKAECCWKSSTTTTQQQDGTTLTESIVGTCSSLAVCAGYAPCLGLEDDLFGPANPTQKPSVGTETTAPGPDTTNTENNDGSLYTAEMIFDACENHIDQPNQEKTLCEVVCETGTCCYQQGQTCTDGDFDCSKYAPCEVLNGVNTDSGPSKVELACTNEDDLSSCVAICAEGTCCFTTDIAKSCDVTNPGVICSAFTPCEILYQAEAMDGGGSGRRLGQFLN
jgi:hypothetical protein